MVRGADAHGEPSAHRAAHAAVVLVARRRRGEHIRPQRGRRLRVGSEVRAPPASGLRGPEARERLRAGGGDASALAEVEPVGVRARLAGDDRVPVPPQRCAERERGVSPAESEVESPAKIRARRQLPVLERSGPESRAVGEAGVVRRSRHPVRPRRARRRKARPKRRVQRVGEVDVDAVRAVFRAHVPAPPVLGPAPDAGDAEQVAGIGVKARQKAERVDGGPVPVVQRAEVEAGVPFAAPAVAAEGVELGGVRGVPGGEFEVREQHPVRRCAVAPGVVRLLHLVVLADEDAVVDEIGVARHELVARIGPRPVRALSLAEGAGEIQHATAADADAPVRRQVVTHSVVRPLVRSMASRGGDELGCRHGVPEPKVHGARDRVRPVPRRAAVVADPHARDRLDRDGVQIDAARAGEGPSAGGVYDRRGVPAPPVDEHERVVRGEPAELERPHAGGQVRLLPARKVDGGGKFVERRGHLDLATLKEPAGRVDVADREVPPRSLAGRDAHLRLGDDEPPMSHPDGRQTGRDVHDQVVPVAGCPRREVRPGHLDARAGHGMPVIRQHPPGEAALRRQRPREDP